MTNAITLCLPSFWVYIIQCKNGNFYTGYTVDLHKRYQLHIAGKGAKYTRSFPPHFLAYVCPIYGNKQQAMQLENFIKKMNKKGKKTLIIDPPSLQWSESI